MFPRISRNAINVSSRQFADRIHQWWLALRPPQTRKHWCGNIVFSVCGHMQHLLRKQNSCCFPRSKNASEYFQKHFASSANVSGLRSKEVNQSFCFLLVCAPKKYFGKQRFRNNVSSFAGPLGNLFMVHGARWWAVKWLFASFHVANFPFYYMIMSKWLLRNETTSKNIEK